MKIGLKQKLLEFIKAQAGKAIPHYQLELLAKQNGYRTSNMERRLRECEEVGKNYENGVIKSYYWKQNSQKFDVEKWNSQFYPKQEITNQKTLWK